MYYGTFDRSRINHCLSVHGVQVICRGSIAILKKLDKAFFLLLAGIGISMVQAVGRVQVHVPIRNEVGAQALPEDIAPVKAPFQMPEFVKPQFPAVSVSIVEHDAKEGVLSTKAIQAAIDAVSLSGGGTVVVPAGKWLSGRISLKSNVNLQISQGAELSFSGKIEDYRPAVFTRNEGVEVMSLGACIYAHAQTNIAVTGKGKLIGPPGKCPIRSKAYGSVDKVIRDHSTPVEKRVYEGHNGQNIFLPMFISPINCKNVYIEGVTLERTPFWNIVPVYCDGVIIRGVTVNSVGIPRGDGINMESTKNALIEYSTLNCGDDCFTMKSGRGKDGLRVNKPTENIVVRYCLALKGHGGITVGSETCGMIRNLYVHDCMFDGTGTGIRYKTRRPRGGGGENLTYERIRMKAGTIITADMLGSSRYVGKLASRLPVREINELTPKYRNVLIKDLIVESGSQFVSIKGIPESPFTNVQVLNAEVNCKGLIKLSDAKNFIFKNVNILNQGSTISLLSVRGLKFDNVSFKSQVEVKISDGSKEPKEIMTENIRFVNCTPEKPRGWQETAYKPRKDTSIEFQIIRRRVIKTSTLPREYIYYGLNGRVFGQIPESSHPSTLSSSNIVIMKNKTGQSNRVILLQP